MSKDIFKYGFLILIFPVLQEILFNHINLFGFINPLIYLSFVFVFPVLKNKSWTLIAAFTLGLLIDMLTNEGGINTFALVFVTNFRLFILRFIKGTGFSDSETIDLKELSAPIQFTWVLIIALIHHFLVFFLEQFSFHRFGHLLLKTVLTALLTTLVISFGLQIFMNRKSNVW